MKMLSSVGLVLGGAVLGMGALYALEMAKSKSVADMLCEVKHEVHDMTK